MATEDAVATRVKEHFNLPRRGRWFKAFRWGNWAVSVQGSEMNYSQPLESLACLQRYTSVEVALFYKGRWVCPSVVGLDPEYGTALGYGRSNAVAGYVPLAQVKDLLGKLPSLPRPRWHQLGKG